MSFDLFTYIGESTDEKLSHWQKCLENAGIVCRIPQDLDLSDQVSEFKIECQIYPPLAEQGTYIDDCDFLIEPMPIDQDHINELIENSDDPVLIEKLKKAQYEVVINTNDESQDVALKLICFVSATLANTFDGVLFDPQEHGAAYGTKVYDIARYYTQYTPEPRKVEKPTQQKPKEESTVLVRAGFIIFFIIVLIKTLRTL